MLVARRVGLARQHHFGPAHTIIERLIATLLTYNLLGLLEQSDAEQFVLEEGGVSWLVLSFTVNNPPFVQIVGR